MNGIQTMSADVTNLLADYPGLVNSGADLLRLSPRAEGMVEVVQAFDQVRQGAGAEDAHDQRACVRRAGG